MRGRLAQPLWIVPLVIAGLVGAFGWWGNARLRQMIEGQLTAELTTALNANVMALEIWTTNQAKLASSLADEPRTKAIALRILDGSGPAHGEGKQEPQLLDEEELGNYLRPRLAKVGYEVAQLVNTNYVVVANSRRGRPRPGLLVSEAHVHKFAELFASGQPVIITPFKPRLPAGRRPRPGGGERQPVAFGRPFDGGAPPSLRSPEGKGNGPPPSDSWRSRRGDVTLMQVAAPVQDSGGAVRGALALIINPDAEFTRILSVARPGRSGETYAFDQHGLMISRSRFDENLKKLGLIEDRPGASSALTLRLTDPGGDLTEGSRFENSSSNTLPLTRIIADAVAGGGGVDVKPSRDYRGVPVVGAWRWLPQLGFGVVTQIDAKEAYQPLRMLQLLFMILFLLLLLCAIGMFLLNLLWRRRLSEATLKMKQLGQYTLEEKIGEGGMGVVYRAHHALMRRETAVKLLLPDRADRASIERFQREVRLTCQLSHPNTIQVYDYGHTPEGIFYYAMEFLRGLNLHDLVGRFGPTPEGRAIQILAQVCDSLSEAHGLGLVHRDIKPANVFLCDRGGVTDCVKVLDFGLVRDYRNGRDEEAQAASEKGMLGTPSFMPPEAIKGSGNSDPRGDIYSVGALAYYLLTAENVFDAGSVRELYNKHLAESPISPSQRTPNPISPELDEMILRCLAKEPDDRPQTITELRRLLLASPHASDWGLESRTAWWARYNARAKTGDTVTEYREPGAAEPTVKIKFAGSAR